MSKPSTRTVKPAKPTVESTEAPTLIDQLRGHSVQEIEKALAQVKASANRGGYIKFIKDNIDKLDDRAIKTIHSNVRRCVDPTYKPRYQPKAK